VRKPMGNHLTNLIPGGVKANEPALEKRTTIIIIIIINPMSIAK